MIADATQMDGAILVCSATDGPMPQRTSCLREHHAMPQLREHRTFLPSKHRTFLPSKHRTFLPSKHRTFLPSKQMGTTALLTALLFPQLLNSIIRIALLPLHYYH